MSAEHMLLSSGVVADLDGTLARLDVDWEGLRAELGVRRLTDLWMRPRAEQRRAFAVVARAELSAAWTAQINGPLVEALLAGPPFTVLTDNSEASANVIMTRIKLRPRVIVGRESLEGSKRDFDCFDSGLARCLSCLGDGSSTPQLQLTYVGDQPYELAYASRLGMDVIDSTVFWPAGFGQPDI